MLSRYLESRKIKRNTAVVTMWFAAFILMLNLMGESAAELLSNDVPRMLPRPVNAQTVLVKDGEPRALIVASQEGHFAEARRRMQEIVHKMTGVTVPLRAPSEVTGERGLLLTSEAKRKNLVFVGNLSVNAGLFEPYLRRFLVADEDEPGPGKFRLVTHPNPWGTGVGLLLIGASDAAGLAKALDAFAGIVTEYGKLGQLALKRLVLPGPDPLESAIQSWKRLARPKNEDWLEGFKQSKEMHLGYHVARMLLQFTLITELGYLTADEVNDIENEVLENILMFPEKVWWYPSHKELVGGRHEMFKNPRLYLAVEHLLKVGRPNAEARRRLEQLAQGLQEYMHYVVAEAYRSDAEGTDDGHAWQSAIWFALLRGDWEYFESGRAREAAFYSLHQTDNLGGLSGHIQYGGVADLNVPSTVRNALRAAAWWYQDGRFRWLLEQMPFSKEYPYGFALNLPMDGITPQKPLDLLGVQTTTDDFVLPQWLPISPHSYESSVKNTDWQQPNISRDKTVDLLTFRDGYEHDDQYLCLDGFQNHAHPLGLNSVLRYVDRGKLFLVAHTGKEGNYYKSGVVVSRGVQTEPEPWGVELIATANLPNLGFTATRFPNANGCDWTRCIFWKRGEYFLFLDDLTARESGQFNLTATWRTCSPAQLTDEGWTQTQGNVTFWLKPSCRLDQRAGKAPIEEYQNEVVPYLLRQGIQFSAERKGVSTSFQNILYATGPGDEQSFAARQISPTACLVRGTRTRGGNTTMELALMGVGKQAMEGLPIETDAALFYISSERVGFADGTFLRWRGIQLAARTESGDIETEVSGAQSQKLSGELANLWESARTEKQPAGEIVQQVKLQEKWTFDGFREHHRAIVPSAIEKSPDGKSWTCHFEKKMDLAKVVIGITPAVSVGEASRVSIEELVVDFSNDGFKQDVRAATLTPKRSSRIVGPHGKSFFTTQYLLTTEGQHCRDVQTTLTKWKEKRPGATPSIGFVEFYSAEREPATITRLIARDLDGDGRREAVALTRDNQFVVLDSEGRLVWRRTFEHNLMSLEALDADGDRAKEILACDAAGDLYYFGADGSLEKKLQLKTSDNIYEDFFRSNRAYSMGLWHSTPGSAPALLLGTYQSIAWVTAKGDIVCWPPESDELPYRSGYVWRGLVYWEKALPNSIDLNGDGVEDQAFISRGWAALPSVMFFDGTRHDALAEYSIPNGRTIGLEVIRLAEGRDAILAVNEFHLGLYSTNRAQELQRVRFDTPAAAYAVMSTGSQLLICVAKRDGLVMTLDMNGKIIDRQLLSPELTAIAPIQLGKSPHLLVASDRGITILTTALKRIGYWKEAVSALAALDDTTVLAACCNGKIIALVGK